MGALTLLAAFVAFAHPGGLDGSGCHHDRRQGGYHCHRGAPRVAPAQGSWLRAPARGAGGFANCAQARAAGAAPVRRGDAGYAPHLDRDNDGIGCE